MATTTHMLPRTKSGMSKEEVDSVKVGADQSQPVKKKIIVYRSNVLSNIFCFRSKDFSSVTTILGFWFAASSL